MPDAVLGTWLASSVAPSPDSLLWPLLPCAHLDLAVVHQDLQHGGLLPTRVQGGEVVQ